MDLIRQLCAIAGVLLLLWLTAGWLRRKGYATAWSQLPSSGTPKDLEVLQRLLLTPQHSLQLVRARQQVLLVGLHPAGFTILAEISGGLVKNAREALTK